MSTNSWLSTPKVNPTAWLLTEAALWVRYHTLMDRLDWPEEDPEVVPRPPGE